ncbi:MAG: hypothetical protein IPK04_18855 [Bdellovibrionales bacterium]|jgi:hypothetical protein|nr:hypothetical protein [Bdellovibrionales bacterium]
MTIFKLEGIPIQISTSKIRMYRRINDRIVLCLDDDFPSKCLISQDLELRKKYIELAWSMTSGVLCFDLKGNLLWKAPEVVDRNHPDLQGEDLTINFHGSVYIQFRYDQENNHIIANTSHGHIVTIAIETGNVISIIQGK